MIPIRLASGNTRLVFRYFLQSDKTFVPLAQEMQIVRAYLEVEQSRLGNRLHVEIQVEDAALEVVPIPVLSIQHLVENAIKHGVASGTGADVFGVSHGLGIVLASESALLGFCALIGLHIPRASG